MGGETSLYMESVGDNLTLAYSSILNSVGLEDAFLLQMHLIMTRMITIRASKMTIVVTIPARTSVDTLNEFELVSAAGKCKHYQTIHKQYNDHLPYCDGMHQRVYKLHSITNSLHCLHSIIHCD